MGVDDRGADRIICQKLLFNGKKSLTNEWKTVFLGGCCHIYCWISTSCQVAQDFIVT